MKDQELLEQISRKLSALISVLFIKDGEKMTSADRIIMLGRFDLSNQDIADILGTTKPTVEVLKSRIKRGMK